MHNKTRHKTSHNVLASYRTSSLQQNAAVVYELYRLKLHLAQRPHIILTRQLVHIGASQPHASKHDVQTTDTTQHLLRNRHAWHACVREITCVRLFSLAQTPRACGRQHCLTGKQPQSCQTEQLKSQQTPLSAAQRCRTAAAAADMYRRLRHMKGLRQIMLCTPVTLLQEINVSTLNQQFTVTHSINNRSTEAVRERGMALSARGTCLLVGLLQVVYQQCCRLPVPQVPGRMDHVQS